MRAWRVRSGGRALVALTAWALTGAIGFGAQSFEPAKDGTLVDGGIYGPKDGVADAWDWSFNDSGYEGTITLVTTGNEIDSRVVWEYNLSTLTIPAPVTAELHFTLRGTPIFPFPQTEVRVYQYPADLQETTADFNAGPAMLQGSALVSPFQTPTAYSLDVSAAVNSVRAQGGTAVAFRFQIDPDAVDGHGQAFIDAMDSDPSTKPSLVIDAAPATPEDVDEDGNVDLDDFLFSPSFPTCMTGPDSVAATECVVFDFNADSHVDEADFALFQAAFAGGPSQK